MVFRVLDDDDGKREPAFAILDKKKRNDIVCTPNHQGVPGHLYDHCHLSVLVPIDVDFSEDGQGRQLFLFDVDDRSGAGDGSSRRTCF